MLIHGLILSYRTYNIAMQLKEIIEQAKKIVFFTGAGISTESGIPDFRSSNGLYNQNKRAEEIISASYFHAFPQEFYDFYREKMILKEAQPNVAHLKIAEIEKDDNQEVWVVTQNIDGLHQKAGSQKVLELHGSIHRNYCQKCHQFYPLEKIINEDLPICECGGLIKPDVVLYEEPLDEATINKTVEVIMDCDCLIICGTSLAVYPAAAFINYFRGQYLVIINRDATPADNKANLVIHENLASVFQTL